MPAANGRAGRKQLAGFAALPRADIPSILTAAGTTVAYATVYAAYALYGFLDPAFAFVLLGAVALATLGAALLHGPALAALGLVGAYRDAAAGRVATQPNYWALYIYLAVVTAAAFALARMRLWRWLAFTAVAFGFFWLLPGIARHADRCADAASVPRRSRAYALVGGADRRRLSVRPGGRARQDRSALVHRCFRSISFGALLLVLAQPSRSGGADASSPCSPPPPSPSPGGPMPRPARSRSRPCSPASSSLRWALAPEIAHLIAAPGAAGAAAPQPWHADIDPHIALGFGFRRAVRRRRLSGAGPLARRRSIPILWSAAGVATPLLILIALYYRIAGFERSIPFAGLALLLAALYGFATETLGQARTAARASPPPARFMPPARSRRWRWR